MIEKIMKAIKSRSKKRGRNITIGAVVGFLLSCTAVMGVGEIGLKIDNFGNGIEFIKDGERFDPQSEKNPYVENSWEKGIYANNTIILGYSEVDGSYGVKLSRDLTGFSFINNSLIIGVAVVEYEQTNGIYMDSSSKAGDIINNGVVKNRKHGICIESLAEAESIINNGTISITANYGSPGVYGIVFYGDSAKVKYIKNAGLIKSTTSGIDLESSALVDNIINNGVIYGGGAAVSVYNYGGPTVHLYNYGILATKENLVIKDSSGKFNIKNYGLEIERANGIVSNGSDYDGLGGRPTDIVVGYNDSGNEIKRNMTIKNTNIQGGGSGSGTSTDSFTFLSNPNEFDNSILNGKNETLKVSGEDREVKGSIINAYGTAVVFGEADKKLTLSGTIVNGGVDEANNITVSGSGGGDTLILQSGEVEYVGGGTGTQNTVINGNIAMKGGADTITVDAGVIINGNVDMGDGDDVLNIANGGKINGTLDGKTGNDTLNFGENGTAKTRAASSSDEIRIMHNISGFENINVNSNVTFYEKTVKDDGSIEKLAISGVNEINISAGSVLNLRIDTTETNGRYEGHALFGNTALTINGDASSLGKGESIIESENGTYNVGVLNLVTNGLGLNSIIAMDGITLDEDLFTKTNSILDKAVILKTDEGNGKAGDIKVEADKDIFREVKASSQKYEKLNDIYNGVISSTDDNFIALKNIITINNKTEDYTSVTDSEQLAKLLAYLGDIYTGSPYSYSSELSRRSVGMFRDIVEENQFIPNLNQWLIMGGLTHADGGTKDTYYGRNYHGFDTGTSDTEADMKLTGAYALAKYGYSENISLGVAVGGNRSEAEMSMSKVKGNSGYIGAFAENYKGNLTLKAGAGIQYSEYDAARRTIGGHNYDEKYSDMAYDIYLNGRYSHNIGNNLFLEPYGTLSYTYIKQDGTDEGSKTLAIETDSKSFDYTVGKVGVDLKKVIPHEKGKSTITAGVSYTKILDGADEEYITGRFKGGSDFDILVAHKNEHSIGLNAKYALELENGVLFDVKGTYAVERDSHNGTGKNKTKGEWIIGAGLGYKF